MKRNLTTALACICGIMLSVIESKAQNAIKGPSSSQTPYISSITPNTTITSILSVGDAISGYKMAGIPDGLGAFDNGNGTFTLLMNHEVPFSGTTLLGAVRAHGSTGAFVSKWVINKSDLSVVSGIDLIQNVKLWNGTSYVTYNAGNPSTLAGFARFCSADLPPVAAFYNSVTGMGTAERIFMNGEENNAESRAMAHIVTGANGGTSYELPYLGKAAWENLVATPNSGDKTVVVLLNDGLITDSKLYIYIGAKTNTGTEIDKAGLSNGKPWAVQIVGFPQERASTTVSNTPPAPGTRFNLLDIGYVNTMTGAASNTAANTAGATKFARVEDGAWDPSHPNDFYFNTTDQLDQVNDGIGTQVGRSKVWRLRFDDIANPTVGGIVEAVLDGTEGANMFDNMAIDKDGHIMLLEDVGNAPHNGKVWQYTIATDALTMVAKHDPSRFGDIGMSATAPFNQDEETSGIIDVQDILGKGKFLVVDQAHYATTPELVEGGQLLMINMQPYAPIITFDNFNISVSGPGIYLPNFLISNSTGAKSFSLVGTAASLSGNNLIGLVGGSTVTVTGMVSTVTGYLAGAKTAIVTVFTDATITFNGFNMTVGGANIDLSALVMSNSSGAKSFAINGSAATLAGNILTAVNAGSVTITGTVGTATGFNAVSKSVVINIANQIPSITFNGFNITVGGANVDLATVLATNSTGAKTFAVNGSAAALAGNILTAVSSGTVTITGSVALATGFNAASQSVIVNVVTVASPVSTVNPTITFIGFTLTVGGTINLDSLLKSNSAGVKSFSVSLGDAVTIVGLNLTAVKEGTATIVASIASTTGFNAISGSAVVTVVSGLPLSVDQFEKVLFALYPNPVIDGVVYFTKTISGSIYNASGVEVKQFVKVSQLNVSGLPGGIYLVKTGENELRKFVIE